MLTRLKFVTILAAVALVTQSLAQAAPGDTTLVSVRVAGQTTALDETEDAVISADGHYVAFTSVAADLVPGDTNHRYDVFVRNLDTGAVERVSVDSAGGEANNDSYHPAISADGRYVAFTSQASNLVGTQDVLFNDVYLHDRQTGVTERVAISTHTLVGQSDNCSISADGRYVAFQSTDDSLVADDTNDALDVFVRDRVAGTTERVSVATGGVQSAGGSGSPSISADGQRVAFLGFADDLVPADNNGTTDVFMHDRTSHTTERASVHSGTAGAQANSSSGPPKISGDGHYVTYASGASNLVDDDTNGQSDVFVRDIESATTQRVNLAAGGVEANGGSGSPDISADGRFVTFYSGAANLVTGDTNGVYDIFVWDRSNGAIERVDIPVGGGQADDDSFESSISADGRYVAYQSRGTNLVAGDYNDSTDVFLRDRQTVATTLVTAAVLPSNAAGLARSASNQMVSADGRFVVFESEAANLVLGDLNHANDVFVRDTQSGTTERMSSAANGNAANGGSFSPAISSNGRYVAFISEATDLLAAASDQGEHVFVRDRQSGDIELIDVDPAGVQGNDLAASPTLSADGRYVAFVSQSSNLVADDTTDYYEVFVRDRQLATTARAGVSSAGDVANSDSQDPVISADGRFVAFKSRATNLVANDNNNESDLFVHDRQSGTTELVNVSSGGAQANDVSDLPSISADGRYVAFQSYASNLVANDDGISDVFVRDRTNGTTTKISIGSNGAAGDDYSDSPSISEDGRYVAFNSDATNLVPNDTNTSADVYVRDLIVGTTERVSLTSSGGEADGPSYIPSLSADGRYVAFASAALNLSADLNGSADIYLHERNATTTTITLVATAGADFGNQPLNTTGTHTFELTNTGTITASIIGITMTGANRVMFVPSHNCGSSLAPSASCMITVSFTPTSPGAKKATLRVEVAGAKVRNRALTGTGVAATPAYTLTPSAVDFGNQRRNTSSAPRTITLRNTGSVPLAIQSIGANGGNAALFAVTHTCGTQVAAGATCNIRIVFRPTSTGVKSSTVRVLGSGNTPKHTATLTGTGIN